MRGLPAVFGLLDAVGTDSRERPLRTVVRCPPFKCLEAHDTTELGHVLLRQHAPVAVMAFEALWPDPQRALETLRATAPASHLVVVHADDAPRLRLLRRLWATGLCDDIVRRGSAPRELARVVRQAWADAAVEAAVHAAEALPFEVSRRYVGFLHQLGGTPAGTQRVEAVVRDVQLGLSGIVDYEVLSLLLLPAHARPRMYVQQARPVAHELIWRMAEDSCAALAPFWVCPIEVNSLEFIDAGPPADSEAAAQAPTTVTLPMLVAGELVGCLGLAVTGTLAPPQRALLELVAHQVGISIRHASALEHADQAALVDELTGVHNRRYLMEAIDGEWRRALRYKHPLSVAMVDVDHFKPINDTLGHAVGDAVLREFSHLLSQQLRDTDVVARYGGDEFVVLFHNTGPSEAAQVLERLRLTLEARVLYDSPQSGPVRVSMSAGVAGHPQAGALSAHELLEVADDALRSAKLAGRNRVTEANGRRLAAMGTQSGLRAVERRKHVRTAPPGQVGFVGLGGGPVVEMSAADLGPGGIAVRGAQPFDEGSLGLLFMPGNPRPLACRVVWVKRVGDEHTAGLHFVERADFAR